uniref:Uncharacterized protein n=1 Tax=Sphaerodactylus townsendi TaxID=933632 RepID=A0ACB8G107_9SAUR
MRVKGEGERWRRGSSKNQLSRLQPAKIQQGTTHQSSAPADWLTQARLQPSKEGGPSRQFADNCLCPLVAFWLGKDNASLLSKSNYTWLAKNAPLPILTQKYEELQKEIKDGSEDTLQKGYALLRKVSAHSSCFTGIQEMVDCIQNRIDLLIGQCPAYKERASKKWQLTTNLEDYLQKASTQIKNISPIVSVGLNPGSSAPESEKVMNQYLELANQTKEMAHELELAVRIVKEMEEFETTEVEAFSSKTKLLNEELAMLNKNINLKLEILKPYVTFLKSSNEIGGDALKLKEFYTSEPMQEDIEAKNETLMQSAEMQWQMVLKKILSAQDMGHDFLNLVNMASSEWRETSGSNTDAAQEDTLVLPPPRRRMASSLILPPNTASKQSERKTAA